MFSKLLYWYLGCHQDFVTVLFFEQGLCERECTVPDCANNTNDTTVLGMRISAGTGNRQLG